MHFRKHEFAVFTYNSSSSGSMVLLEGISESRDCAWAWHYSSLRESYPNSKSTVLVRRGSEKVRARMFVNFRTPHKLATAYKSPPSFTTSSQLDPVLVWSERNQVLWKQPKCGRKLSKSIQMQSRSPSKWSQPTTCCRVRPQPRSVLPDMYSAPPTCCSSSSRVGSEIVDPAGSTCPVEGNGPREQTGTSLIAMTATRAGALNSHMFSRVVGIADATCVLGEAGGLERRMVGEFWTTSRSSLGLLSLDTMQSARDVLSNYSHSGWRAIMPKQSWPQSSLLERLPGLKSEVAQEKVGNCPGSAFRRIPWPKLAQTRSQSVQG